MNDLGLSLWRSAIMPLPDRQRHADSDSFDKRQIPLYSAGHERNFFLQQVRRTEYRRDSVLQPLRSAYISHARSRPRPGFVPLQPRNSERWSSVCCGSVPAGSIPADSIPSGRASGRGSLRRVLDPRRRRHH
jgi:hypothetical protein